MTLQRKTIHDRPTTATAYCGVGSCDRTPEHEGVHRCRCGWPVDAPANGCAWHKPSGLLADNLEEGPTR